MISGIERRRHVRAPLALKTVLKTTRGGRIEGKTADISISGLAVILFHEKHDVDDEFEARISLSDEYDITVLCEKIWESKMVAVDTVYNAIGAEFIKISPNDRKALVSMVVEYFKE